MAFSSAPRTPPNDPALDSSVLLAMADLDILNELSAPTFHPPKFSRREAPFDPLILAAAISSGPQVTRHHYFHHDLIPISESTDSLPDSLVASTLASDNESPRPSPGYVSKQMPRSARLAEAAALVHDTIHLESHADETNPVIAIPVEVSATVAPVDEQSTLEPSPDVPENHRATGLTVPDSPAALKKALSEGIEGAAAASAAIASIPRSSNDTAATTSLLTTSRAQPLQVQCRARTRVPTPHGPVFLHIYHNNWDTKEHLAIVIDPAQLEDGEPATSGPAPIRSLSLDAQWHEGETDMERIIRGAYVGRLSATSSRPSQPPQATSASASTYSEMDLPAPLVRIHSECFTGETIGSMRCDCGEQLDEAMRLIAQPQRSSVRGVVPGRGAVVYLRQEGRGIGLLEKIRAYNLQDLGHDTVSANLLLGHGADERGYEIAAAIMKDLGLGGEAEGVRLLTNNPDKMEALQRESVRIVHRVPMVPRSWTRDNDRLHADGRHHTPHHHHHSRKAGGLKKTSPASSNTAADDSDADSDSSFDDYELRRSGATLIGGGAAHGVELERYLRTKVQRMGHMLDLPSLSSTTSTALVTPVGEEQQDAKLMASLPELVSDGESVGAV